MAEIPDAAPIFEEPPQHRYGEFCVHSAYIVQQEQRIVTCKACRANLDPFDILLRRALRQSVSENVDDEIKKKRQRLQALDAEERRVKARVRTAKRKDAEAAVAAERAKAKENHGRALFNLLCAKSEIETALRQLGHEERKDSTDG